MKINQNIKGSLILCTAALIWGLAFVAQSDAADKAPPLLFNGLRSLIAALFLFAVMLVKKARTKEPVFPWEKNEQKHACLGGVLCGALLAVSVNLQQFGLTYYPNGVATEARAGFLTALYVILVPIISIFIGKRPRWYLLLSVAVAMAGIYLLCLSGGLDNIYLGDLFVFLCAISFSFHILVVDRCADAVGGIRLSMLQFLVCGVLSMLLSVLFEDVVWSNVLAATPQILYLGIVSSGIGYTLQIIGQRYAEPTVASLSMSLESVFAALGGWLISGNALQGREIMGCVLVFAAIVLAQLPTQKKNMTIKKE